MASGPKTVGLCKQTRVCTECNTVNRYLYQHYWSICAVLEQRNTRRNVHDSSYIVTIYLRLQHVQSYADKQTWLKISLHYSWMSVTKCYEYRWQLWLHWQANRQAVEQLFICPNGKYFVTRPCCPKDFLWHATHITAAHHIKSLKTRLFCLWEAFASLPRHGRETLRHSRLMFVFLTS